MSNRTFLVMGENKLLNSFFNSRHPSQYRIYNLCAEDKYQYNSAHFENNGMLRGKNKYLSENSWIIWLL